MDPLLTRIVQRILRLPVGYKVLFTIILLGAVFAIWILPNFYFHIVDTIPSTDAFPDVSPVLYIDFNRQLQSRDLNVNFQGVKNSYSVHGTRLTIMLGTTLQADQTYTLRIVSINSTSDERIANQTIPIRVQSVPYDQLPPAVQNLILSRQDVFQPTNRNAIPLIGSNALINDGLSQFQLDAFKQALFLYSQSSKAAITNAVIDTSSIVPLLPGPHDPAGQFTLDFKLTINSSIYDARLQYSGVSVARLILFATSGTRVYDSKNIDDSKIGS